MPGCGSLEDRGAVQLFTNELQGINEGVSRHPDPRWVCAGQAQCRSRSLRRRPEHIRNEIDGTPVELFRPRRVEVPSSEPGFDVADRHTRIETRERTRERRRGVSMNHYSIGAGLLENVSEGV